MVWVLEHHSFNFRILSARLLRIGLCYFFSVLLVNDVFADDIDFSSPFALTPQPSVALVGSVESWKARAQQWYESNEIKAQRKQMRQMSRPLKRSCYYCHTRSFKGYVEEQYLISLQMMAISVEQDLTCEDCHQGRRKLTELGAKSLLQWRYAYLKKMDCSDCHLPKGKFKQLTVEGKKSTQGLLEVLSPLAKKLNLHPRITRTFLQQLESSGKAESLPYKSVTEPKAKTTLP